MLDSFFHVVVPTAPFSSFSTIMMNISSWLPYLNFRSNILSIYFPHTSWFFGMNRNLMVGAIYHRLITTTRKRADVGDDRDFGQYLTNKYYLKQDIFVSISAKLCRFFEIISSCRFLEVWRHHTIIKVFRVSSNEFRVLDTHQILKMTTYASTSTCIL